MSLSSLLSPSNRHRRPARGRPRVLSVGAVVPWAPRGDSEAQQGFPGFRSKTWSLCAVPCPIRIPTPKTKPPSKGVDT